ncbi:MAG: hypothetical protein ABSF91_02250 [Bacteroidota bacterium]|jgi:hypothetical protein
MKAMLSYLILSSLLLFGCKEKTTQSTPSTPQFAIYLLSDTTITGYAAWNMSQDSLVLASEPLVRQDDIKSYWWSTHSFTLQPTLDSVFKRMSTLRGKSFGVPFVVTVDNERIYLGAFWWAYSSSIPQVAYIDVILPSPYQIQRESTCPQPDFRNDRRIHDALKAAGILVE